MAVRDQIVVFWVVLPCNSLSGIYQHFRGTFLLPSSGLRRVVDRLYRDTDMYRRPGGSLCKGVQVPHPHQPLSECLHVLKCFLTRVMDHLSDYCTYFRVSLDYN
jgi:hypothetical protein